MRAMFDLPQRGLTEWESGVLQSMSDCEKTSPAAVGGRRILDTMGKIMEDAEHNRHSRYAVIIAQRLSEFDDLKFGPAAALFAAAICADARHAKMWAWSLVQKARELGGELTLESWHRSVGPFTAPTAEAAGENWDSVPRGWLESPEAWEPDALQGSMKATVH